MLGVYGLTCNVRKMFMVSVGWQFLGGSSLQEGCCWMAVVGAASWRCTASPARCDAVTLPKIRNAAYKT
jgi:hypothetical protein